MRLNANFNERVVVSSTDNQWVPSPAAGVSRWMLDRIGAESARATSVVRYEPKSHFPTHQHPLGEEFLVLEGVFSDAEGDYAAGTYVRNPDGTSHAPWTDKGCMLFVKLRQFDSGDNQRFAVDTLASAQWDEVSPGVSELALHVYQDERVALLRLAPGASMKPADLPGGAEIYVTQGSFSDDQGSYAAGSWLRLPPGSELTLLSEQGGQLYFKTGHLPPALPG